MINNFNNETFQQIINIFNNQLISHINYFFKLSTVSFVGLHNLIVLSAEADTKVVLSYRILIALTD
jgi:hypothetical protein